MVIFQMWQGSFPFWQEVFLQLVLSKHMGMHPGLKAFHCQHCEYETRLKTFLIQQMQVDYMLSSLCYHSGGKKKYYEVGILNTV